MRIAMDTVADLSETEVWLNARMGFILREAKLYTIQDGVLVADPEREFPSVEEKAKYHQLVLAYFHAGDAAKRDLYVLEAMCPRPVGREYMFQ